MSTSNKYQLEQLASCVKNLRSGKYSDFTIRCTDNTVHHVHRAIICSRSRVLAAAVDGVFKEALSQEVFLEDDEPALVEKMINFLYCLDYDDDRVDTREELPAHGQQNSLSSTATEIIPTFKVATVANGNSLYSPLSLVINAKMYIIADKYDIRPLKEHAVTKYNEVLPETWNSTSFSESVRLVQENTMENDYMLRKVILRKVSECIKVLFGRGEFVDLLEDHGELSTAVLRELVFKLATDIPEEVDNWGGMSSIKKDKKKRSRASLGQIGIDQ